jgi:hypothetical protein
MVAERVAEGGGNTSVSAGPLSTTGRWVVSALKLDGE